MPLPIVGTWLFWLGCLSTFAGFFLWSLNLMAWGTLASVMGYAIRDYTNPSPNSVGPVTAFAFLSLWSGVSHIMAGYFIESKYEGIFYSLYPSMDYLVEAQALTSLFILVPLLTYGTLRYFLSGPIPIYTVPKVGFHVSDKTLLYICCTFIGFNWLGNLGIAVLGEVGTLSFLFSSGTQLAVFLLAWHWFGPSPTLPPWTRLLMYGALLAESGFALMYTTRRGNIAYPAFALLMGILLRKAFRWHHLVIGLVVFPLFASVYFQLGGLRGTTKHVQGTERLTLFTGGNASGQNYASEDESSLYVGMLSLTARGCQFGPLSQVVRIADEEGFYYGETLTYLGFVFIPRAIWPEKPLVNPGQWFAKKIGRGTEISETQFSNSINMTLAGEFYLNFGWPGAVIGTLLLTFLCALIWESSGFYDLGNNPLGGFLGLAVLLQMAAVSSAAALVYLISMYLTMLALRQLLGVFQKRFRGLRETKVDAPRITLA